VREASQSGRVIAAICHGYRFLIPAGVVSGRRVTSYRSAAPELTRAGAVWVDEPVVADGNVITARRTANLPRFHRRLIEALTKDGTARDKQA
jgi:protease I